MIRNCSQISLKLKLEFLVFFVTVVGAPQKLITYLIFGAINLRLIKMGWSGLLEAEGQYGYITVKK